MAEGVSVVATPIIWNMITSNHIHAGETVIGLIFSCYARNVTEANRTAAIVKFMIEKWVLIAATAAAIPSSHPPAANLLRLNNAPEPPRKEPDAETERPIQTGDVICTKTWHF
jgi:hypothetical protein